jgi:hypothetical protein
MRRTVTDSDGRSVPLGVSVAGQVSHTGRHLGMIECLHGVPGLRGTATDWSVSQLAVQAMARLLTHLIVPIPGTHQPVATCRGAVGWHGICMMPFSGRSWLDRLVLPRARTSM